MVEIWPNHKSFLQQGLFTVWKKTDVIYRKHLLSGLRSDSYGIFEGYTWHDCAVVNTVASQHKGSGFDPAGQL